MYARTDTTLFVSDTFYEETFICVVFVLLMFFFVLCCFFYYVIMNNTFFCIFFHLVKTIFTFATIRLIT